MSKRKCPQCGLTNIAKIEWGLLFFSDDLQKALDTGKVVLGGCCISDENASYHCNDCASDFGRQFGYHLNETKSIEFIIGSFHSGSTKVTISHSNKEANVKYQPPFHEADQDTLSKKIDIGLWMKFLQEVNKCFIFDWKEEYLNSDILDGIQWELVVIYENNSVFRSSGSNDYPPYWKMLVRVFNKLLIFDGQQIDSLEIY